MGRKKDARKSFWIKIVILVAILIVSVVCGVLSRGNIRMVNDPIPDIYRYKIISMSDGHIAYMERSDEEEGPYNIGDIIIPTHTITQDSVNKQGIITAWINPSLNFIVLNKKRIK